MTVSRPARCAIPEAIGGPGVVAIGRGLDPAQLPLVGEALLSGGVRAFEVTLNSTSALEAIAVLAARFEGDQLMVGAGTVLDISEAQQAVAAGARFIVAPHVDGKLVRWAATNGMPIFPGALTPSEILDAWRAGATAVKLFPASSVGPAFVRELRGPFPEIPLIPTGGVTAESAAAFIAAGAGAVAVGSWLTGSGDPEIVAIRAAELTAAVAQARR
ncbi:bifunctional 4-hydroxy-2-oxoglutarate aldolase/2-dehydro-3-deoxy-phosphogluconate aldolase [soil metagenome]